MFCNFCGKKIAPEDRVCPYCGQAQESRSGGNGFWDILTNPSADDADPEPVRTVREPVRPMREPAPPMPTPPVPSDRRRRKTGRGILILSIITVVLLLASIALDVLLFLNIVGINTKLETISEALTEVDGSTEALAPEATPPASSETKAPTEPATEPTTAATGEPQATDGAPDPAATAENTENGPITEQPVSIADGVKAGESAAKFEISYTGDGCRAVWFIGSKDDEKGWDIIDVSSARFNGRYELIDDNGHSSLKIIGPSEDVYGRYRCEIFQGDSCVATSNTVTFLKSK